MATTYASTLGLFALISIYPSNWSAAAFCITFVVTFVGIIALEALADTHDAKRRGVR